MGGYRSLADSIQSLENTIRHSNIPNLRRQRKTQDSLDYVNYIEYVDFFIAYAVIDGIMGNSEPEEKIDYDLIESEIENILNSSESLKGRIADSSFDKWYKLNKFIKRKVKRIKDYASGKVIPETSLQNETFNVLSALKQSCEPEESEESDKDICDMMNLLGKKLRIELYREREIYNSQPRISPNYIAEIQAIYRLFFNWGKKP